MDSKQLGFFLLIILRPARVLPPATQELCSSHSGSRKPVEEFARALVVDPSRELAKQTLDEFAKLTAGRKWNSDWPREE